MFKILGADGKEYGPVTIDQMAKWIAEGRANRETMAQKTGEPGWKPLGQFPEFADLLGLPPPAIASAMPPAVSPPGLQSPTPPGGFQSSGADDRARALAEQAIKGPAIALMVTAGLGIAISLLGLAMAVAGANTPPPMPGLDPEFVHYFTKFAYGPVGIGSKILSLAVSIFLLYGALQMQKLNRHGLAMATAIIAMIPCFNACCVLGLPFGIWALVVLSKPEVKSQFN
jgi:hypothetical protein